jgi:hypothetical protein
MDRSKISAAIPGCRFVARPEALVGLAETDLILIDLSKKGVVDALPGIVASGVTVIAYGSHVDKALLTAAESAGCTSGLPRSAFVRDLPALLA